MCTKYFRHTLALICVMISWIFVATALANTPELALGESIYKSVSEAVFLIEVLDQGGEVKSLGTAFLIGDQRLVTNYHVVQGGRPHLRVGTLRLECTLESVDPGHDLALLGVPGSISAKPLVLAQKEPPAGSTIFAIGNPAGLERSITEGLVSGRRDIDGQSLLQISASISPGSSGGPVVNSEGQVVGVAVGYLKDGQNLNFAVPVKAVLDLLQGGSGTGTDFDSLLRQVAALNGERDKLDLSSEEEWESKTRAIDAILQEAKSLAAGSPERLISVAEIADQAYNGAIAIEAARAALQALPKGDLRAHRIIAHQLEAQSWFSDEGEKEKILSEALRHAQLVAQGTRQPNAGDLYMVASILEKMPGKREEAFARFQQALVAARAAGEKDIRLYLRALFRSSGSAHEASAWFKQIVENGGAEEFDWIALARRYFGEREYNLAAEAWLRAAELRATSESMCNAALGYWLANQTDQALSLYRLCIEISIREEDSKGRLTEAYRVMSSILFDRGVYDQSILYAKQAIALSPEEPWAYYNLSRGLEKVGRSAEAAAAAESAIRLSDGKFPEMHFALGAAYFDLQNWNRSAQAFQKAAELDPKDSAAAYNVALCFHRQHFYLDAARWYEEVLRRRPDYPERDQILKIIRILRQ